MAYCVDIYNFPSSIEYEYKWEGNYGANAEFELCKCRDSWKVPAWKSRWKEGGIRAWVQF